MADSIQRQLENSKARVAKFSAESKENMKT